MTPIDSDGTATFEKPITDQLIQAELLLPHSDNIKMGKVIGRTKDAHGIICGTYDHNPFMNTLTYNVQFPDGDVREYSANVIAQNMYAQVDANGHHHNLLDAIIDVRKNKDVVDKKNQYITTKSGQCCLTHTTTGWNFLVSWKDGSEE